MSSGSSIPDAPTASAFVGVVLVGGANLVAVRFTTGDVAPMFGAGARFGLAGVLMLALATAMRVPGPKREELIGTTIYGFLAFGGAMGFAYFALQQLPAGIGGVFVASVPIVTLFLAWAHGLEHPGWRGFAGALLTLGGIWILLAPGSAADLPIPAALAMFASAVCMAEAGIVIKKFPPCHPIASNGLAMTIGGIVLTALSVVVGEEWSLPTTQTVWIVFGYMVLVGSMGLFAMYLYVLKGWTASAASFQFVLIPVVTALLGAAFLGEPIGASFAIGTAVVLLGVYLGALSARRAAPPTSLGQEAQALRCATT